MASREQEKGFEEIELGPIHPVLVVQSLPDQLSQDSDQNTTGRRVVTEEEAKEHTAYAYKPTLKHFILAALWMVSYIDRHSLQSSDLRQHSTIFSGVQDPVYPDENILLTTH